MADNKKVGFVLEVDTKSLKAELKAATAELIKLQSSSSSTAEEIGKAAQRAADLRNKISSASQTIAAFNPEAKFAAFSTVVQGLAGAFSATQGALALVGIEGENVQQALLKVQGALALSEGLNTVLSLKDGFANLSSQVQNTSTFIAGNNAVTAIAGKVFKILGVEIETSAVAFKVLKGAIASTGLGLLVVGLGEAVSLFKDFINGAENAAKAKKEFDKQQGELDKKQRDDEKAFIEFQKKSRVAEAKQKGTTAKEVFDIEDGFRKQDIDSQKRLIKETQKRGLSILESEKELDKLNRDRELSKKEFLATQAEEIRNNNKANLKKQEADNEEAINKFIEQQQKRIDRLRDLDKIGKSDYQQKLDELKNNYNEDLKTFEGNEEAKKLALKKYEEAKYQLLKEERERISKLEDDYADKQIEKLDKQREKRIAQEAKTMAMITSTMDKSIAKQIRTIQETDTKKLQFKEKSANAEIDIAVNLGNLLQQIAGQNKELAIAGIVVSQAASIAKIVQNTQVANAEALVLSPLTGGQPLVAYNYINMGLGIAASIASGVQAIQQINNAGNGSTSISAGGVSAGGGSAPIAPRSPEPTPTMLDQKSLNTIQNVVARAYVVESDITGSQKRIQRIENAARF
jgi:hypothetical protein